MRLKVPHRSGPDGGGVDVGRTHDHLDVLTQSPGTRRVSVERAEDGVGRLKVRQFRALYRRDFDERVVIRHVGNLPVIRQPMHDDGIERGGEATGEAQADVIHRLEEFVGALVDFGMDVFEIQNVRDGILARVAGDAARQANPFDQLPRRVALDFESPAADLTDVRRAARVHPDDRVTQRIPRLVHRHRPGPLAGGGDRDDVRVWREAARQQSFDGCVDGSPPFVRGLFRPAVFKKEETRLLEFTAEHFPLCGKQCHFWARRTEINCENIFVCHACLPR